MFIKTIVKRNKSSEKSYTYYRLVHTYKIGKKVRQQNILNLGKLEGVDKEDYKKLADRIEEILTGTEHLFSDIPEELETKAQYYSKKIIEKGVFPVKKKKRVVSKELSEDYQQVDINSIEQEQSRTIGGEWLVNQALDDFDMPGILKDSGMNEKEQVVAEKLITAKMLHPSSELETERWLIENSGISEIYRIDDDHPTSRYRLYKASEHMYKHKEEIEKQLYSKTYDIFSGRSKIVIYDLTNMYFEGQMRGSKKSRYGRSKQKRNDRPLIGLALAIDSLGFVRYSKIYPGNVGEPTTFEEMLNDVEKQMISGEDIPMIVMDAGIATDDNLEILKNRKYDYVCVSRVLPTDYTPLSEKPTELEDNRKHKIEVTKIFDKVREETFLHIKSAQKQMKEEAIDNKLTQRFLESMEYLKQGLTISRRLKKISAVHEKVGRLKDQYSKVAKNYKITYTEDKEKGVVTDIKWEKQENKQRPKGEYFLRYSKEVLSDKQIWDMYNLTREVEACFRFLKTDLSIRPIHHQKDKYIEPHIWLGIVAYQIAHYIRLKLKQNGIKYSWKTIVEKMQSQQISIVSLNKKGDEKIYTKLVTRPSEEQKKIYDALGYKHRPFVRITKVVPQM